MHDYSEASSQGRYNPFIYLLGHIAVIVASLCRTREDGGVNIHTAYMRIGELK